MKLDIQKFAVSKSTTFSESNLNTNTNTSSLTITIYFSANNTSTWFSSETLYCTCNGVTQSANVSHPKGGSTTKSFTFNNIAHNSDGTKTVSWSWSCATGTQGLGTVSASGTRALTTLHKPPLITGYTIEETNQVLIDAGISDDVFVSNLSQKEFNITYTLYDNATFSKATIYNSTTYVYQDTSLPITIDLTANPLRVDTSGVPIFVSILDNKNARSYYTNAGGSVSSGSSIDYYTCIPYIPIAITTTTNAKRVGQLSGQVALNIDGVYYNSTVGNVDQTSYKPTIKYKYWKYGDSEPATYTNTVSSNDITISNGTFSVSSLNIGSTTETDTNYFNPEYAYRIKVYVEDNFTSAESNELSITIGEATWTEYKDRVDFKKITINGEDPIFYIAGDTEKIGTINSNFIVATGFTSGGATDLYYSFVLPKRLDNITTISVTSFYGKLRGTSGYLNNNGNNIEFVGASGYTIYITKPNQNTITIRLHKSSAFTNVSNNTPIVLEGQVEFEFS